MNQYILNLIPRIMEAGKKLNQVETIVDKVWVKYDEEDYETYRFRRNNLVLVSLAGFVEERKWELLPPNGLYISKDGRGLMYRQAVVFDSIMLVQLESRQAVVFDSIMLVQLESIKYQPIIFYDEAKIPDGDVVKYLTMMFANRQINETQKVVINQPKVEIPIQITGKKLVLKREYHNPSIIGSEVYINYVVAENGKYYTVNEAVYKWIIVKNGKVSDYEYH